VKYVDLYQITTRRGRYPPYATCRGTGGDLNHGEGQGGGLAELQLPGGGPGAVHGGGRRRGRRRRRQHQRRLLLVAEQCSGRRPPLRVLAAAVQRRVRLPRDQPHPPARAAAARVRPLRAFPRHLPRYAGFFASVAGSPEVK
jgi:hypothetical protein